MPSHFSRFSRFSSPSGNPECVPVSQIDQFLVQMGKLLTNQYQVTQQFSVADLRGGARDARPPPGGPNSFIFMQFSAEKIS